MHKAICTAVIALLLSATFGLSQKPDAKGEAKVDDWQESLSRLLSRIGVLAKDHPYHKKQPQVGDLLTIAIVNNQGQQEWLFQPYGEDGCVQMEVNKLVSEKAVKWKLTVDKVDVKARTVHFRVKDLQATDEAAKRMITEHFQVFARCEKPEETKNLKVGQKVEVTGMIPNWADLQKNDTQAGVKVYYGVGRNRGEHIWIYLPKVRIQPIDPAEERPTDGKAEPPTPKKPEEKKGQVQDSANQNERRAASNTAFGRKWTDASGKFSTEADLVEVKEGRAILRKKNGKLTFVPLEKLSAADQEFIKSLEKPKEDAAEPKSGGLSLRRGEGLSLTIDAGRETVAPFVAFAFFSKPPAREQLQAAMKYMRARFNNLSTTKVAVGNDKNNKMTGLEIMQFVGGYTAENENTSLTLSPFYGSGNASGHYGLMGDFFDIGKEKVAFVVVYCVEIGKNKPTKHDFDFDGLGLNAEVVKTIRASKGMLVLSCNPDGKLGASAEHVEE